MALFGWAFRRRRVLSVTQPAWDEFSLSSCDVNQFSAFCYTTRLGWVQPFLLWYESIQCFLLHNQVGMSSVFPSVMCTNSVLSVTQPGWDEFSLSFCDVNQFSAFCCTTRLRWVQSFLLWCLSFCDVNQFSAFCCTTRLRWVQSFLLWFHQWSFFIHHSSLVIHGILNHSSFIIHHSSFKSIKNQPKINPKSTKIGLGATRSGLDPFKRGSGSLSWDQLIFWGCPERNHHSGPKWWFRSRVRACQKVTKLIHFRKYHKS